MPTPSALTPNSKNLLPTLTDPDSTVIRRFGVLSPATQTGISRAAKTT
jgi:hypothetical protein